MKKEMNPTASELREKYSDAYAWVDAQPGMSWDFVTVPIESIATLLQPTKLAKNDPSNLPWHS